MQITALGYILYVCVCAAAPAIYRWQAAVSAVTVIVSPRFDDDDRPARNPAPVIQTGDSEPHHPAASLAQY